MNKRKSDHSTRKPKKKKAKNTVINVIKRLDNKITTVYWSGDQSGSLQCSDGECSSADVSLANNSQEDIPDDNIKYFNSTNVKVIVLKKDTFLYISGAFKMQVLCGGIYAFGYEFQPGNRVYDIFSLRGWSQLYLQSGVCRNFNTEHNYRIKELLKHYDFEKEVIKEICGYLNTDMTIICCLPQNDIFLKYIEKCISAIILPPLVDEFQVYFNEHPTAQALEVGETWSNLVTYDDRKLKVMLCGGKRAGKSTLLRFMINKLLMFHDRVCVIDLDPGQSEFTMAGCISIVVVDKPMFGPNFTHQIKPVRSILQNVDVSYTPLNYIEAVQELYKMYLNLDQMPTLINTMGFTKGLGLEIMCTTIVAVDPRTIVEIKLHKQQNDFAKPLTKDTVKENCATFISWPKVVLNYELVTIRSFENESTGFKPPGYLCRDISTIAYFGNILDRCLSLRSGSIHMYTIHLDNVTVLDSEYHLVKPENKAAVINANLVVLCSPSQTKDIYICYGYGIVRSIINKNLYVITPVNDLINEVTHLIVGIVQMPSCMLDDGMLYDTPIPYFAVGCLSNFTHVPRRSYLPRKSV